MLDAFFGGLGAAAEPVTFAFTGSVTEIEAPPGGGGVSPVPVGAPIWGSYTFKSTTPGQIDSGSSDINERFYADALLYLDVYVGNFAFERVVPSYHSTISVRYRGVWGGSELFSNDEYLVDAASEPMEAGPSLLDFTLKIWGPDLLSDASLPLEPPLVADDALEDDLLNLYVSFEGGNWYLFGRAESLTLVPTLPVSQSEEQQACINAMNRSGALLAAAQGKSDSLCIARAASGRRRLLGGSPDEQTAQDCLGNDVTGKVIRSTSRLMRKEKALCQAAPEQYPGFAFSGWTGTALAAWTASRGIVEDLFGSDLDAALVARSLNRSGSICQKTTHDFTQKLFDALWGAACKGKEAALSQIASLDSGEELQVEILSHLGSSRERSVAKASQMLVKKIDKTCGAGNVAGDLENLFPGKCIAPDAASLATCARGIARCRFCQSLNQTDRLAIDCDAFDNSTSDGSCS